MKKEYVVTIYINGEKEHFELNAENDEDAISKYKSQVKENEVSYLSRIEKDRSCTEISGTHEYSWQYK